MKLQPALYILDAYGLIYRSYFAFLSRPLLNSAGKNISALFGFARTVMMLIDEGAPAAGRDRRVKCLATVFDSLSPTFRHKKYPDYKATRQKAPEDLHEQVRLVEEFLSALGVPPLRVDGFEADDIIATLVKKCREDKRLCYIVSSDKDLLQLVGNGAWALRPRKSAPGDGNPVGSPFSAGLNYELVSADDIKEEWGVPPEKVLDLLSLVGDASDNIPGVKGIGEKTAVKLMARYGSLEEIYGNIAGIEGSVGKKLALGQENAFFARELIALDNNVPLAVDNLDQFSVENLNRTAGASMLLREGIRQIARQLDPKAQPSAEVPPAKTRIAASQVSGGGEASPKTAVDPDLLGPGTYRAVMDIAELEAIVKAGQKKGALALDFETDSLDAWNARPLGISIAIKSREAVYVPLAPHRGTRPGGMERAPFIEPEPVREILRPLFADPRMTIIAHNAKFDYKVSRGWGIPRWTCRIWDTMVAAWVDDSDRGNYSLDSLAAFHFEYTAIAYNDIVPRGGTFDQIDLDTAIRYAAEDADLCFRMKTLLEKRLAVPGSESLFYDLEMPLLPVLAEMEGTGIKIDPPALEQYGKELAEELRKIERKTYNTVGHEFNLGSTKQLQEVLFRERKLNPGKKTKTGYSTDMAVLEELARVDPVPALILRHRTLAKLRSTYVDTLAAQA